MFRFTPTRVGTTGCVNLSSAMKTVHPHACGDNGSYALTGVDGVGSPPRVWGQLVGQCGRDHRLRFTPTRVGTTLSTKWDYNFASVHPHACGDNAMREIASQGRCGSPPRVWGQLSRYQNDLRAGGSPPRVWGQPSSRVRTHVYLRFTPTRVGTTSAYADTRRRIAVHPHACGDNANNIPQQTQPDGSPPRVWGQHVELNPEMSVPRFTPTRVGTTSRRWRQFPCQAVHPHACGDNSRSFKLAGAATGSPPRVWGQL